MNPGLPSIFDSNRVARLQPERRVFGLSLNRRIAHKTAHARHQVRVFSEVQLAVRQNEPHLLALADDRGIQRFEALVVARSGRQVRHILELPQLSDR